jgi:hypothetical protein
MTGPKLPMAHLSIRVPWHDLGWAGLGTSAPGRSTTRRALRSVKERRGHGRR